MTTALAPTTASSADRDRGDQDRAGADAAPVADPGRVLARAVEVGRDRRRADVDRSPDLGVAQIGQVPHDRPGSQVRLIDLDERADLDAVVEHGPVAEMGERPDPAVRADP